MLHSALVLNSTPPHLHTGATDLTHVNILAELYMEAGRFEQTHTLIEKAERMLQESEASLSAGCGSGEEGSGALMPLDLVVKSGGALCT